MNRTIIFDLDGTLVDSRADLVRAGNHARATLGLAPVPPETVAGFVGDGAEKLIERLTPAVDAGQRAAALGAFGEFYARHCCEETRPYPGILTMLDRLREAGWLLAVATNKPLRFTRAILDACGLGFQFAAVRGGDGPRKPDPGQLLSIFAELASEPAANWMVGDHHTDIRAAHAAGCRALWCEWGIGQHSDLPVDGVAESPAEVVRLVAT